MNTNRPSLPGRLYNWIYGNEEYVPLKREHRPRSECWETRDSTDYPHLHHVNERDPSIVRLSALGNYPSDNMLWLFEALAILNQTQQTFSRRN